MKLSDPITWGHVCIVMRFICRPLTLKNAVRFAKFVIRYWFPNLLFVVGVISIVRSDSWPALPVLCVLCAGLVLFGEVVAWSRRP